MRSIERNIKRIMHSDNLIDIDFAINILEMHNLFPRHTLFMFCAFRRHFLRHNKERNPELDTLIIQTLKRLDIAANQYSDWWDNHYLSSLEQLDKYEESIKDKLYEYT